MNVDIDFGRVDRKEQCNHRKVVAEQEVRISRPHRAKQHLVAHRPAVDEIELKEAVGARKRRQPREARDHDAVPRQPQGHGVGGEVVAHHLRQPRRQRAGAVLRRPVQRVAIAALDDKMHLRAGHGEPPQYVGDGGRFRPFGFEEFEPRRHGGKKLPDLNYGPLVHRLWYRPAFGAPADLEPQA